MKKEICLHLKFGNCKGNTKVKCYQVVEAILYRLKTGCQWRQLPMKQFFSAKYGWPGVYHIFRNGAKMVAGIRSGVCCLKSTNIYWICQVFNLMESIYRQKELEKL
ncbi:MAG: transposase [Bacteroidetes bacterium]|nr:transposase [Bacteroidota bacterium]